MIKTSSSWDWSQDEIEYEDKYLIVPNLSQSQISRFHNPYISHSHILWRKPNFKRHFLRFFINHSKSQLKLWSRYLFKSRKKWSANNKPIFEPRLLIGNFWNTHKYHFLFSKKENVCLSVCLSVSQFVSLFVCLPDRQSVCLSEYVHACQSVCDCLSVCLTIFGCLSVCVYLSMCMQVCLCVYLSVCVSVCVWMSICQSMCMSICVGVCLSSCVCLCSCVCHWLSFCVWVSICESVCVYVFVSVCVSVSLSVFGCLCASFWVCVLVCVCPCCVWLSLCLSVWERR